MAIASRILTNLKYDRSVAWLAVWSWYGNTLSSIANPYQEVYVSGWLFNIIRAQLNSEQIGSWSSPTWLPSCDLHLQIWHSPGGCFQPPSTHWLTRLEVSVNFRKWWSICACMHPYNTVFLAISRTDRTGDPPQLRTTAFPFWWHLVIMLRWSNTPTGFDNLYTFFILNLMIRRSGSGWCLFQSILPIWPTLPTRARTTNQLYWMSIG